MGNLHKWGPGATWLRSPTLTRDAPPYGPISVRVQQRLPQVVIEWAVGGGKHNVYF